MCSASRPIAGAAANPGRPSRPSSASSASAIGPTKSPHTLSRGKLARSISTTSNPRPASRAAAAAPAGPPPSTATSQSRSSAVIVVPPAWQRRHQRVHQPAEAASETKIRRLGHHPVGVEPGPRHRRPIRRGRAIGPGRAAARSHGQGSARGGRIRSRSGQTSAGCAASAPRPSAPRPSAACPGAYHEPERLPAVADAVRGHDQRPLPGEVRAGGAGRAEAEGTDRSTSRT